MVQTTLGARVGNDNLVVTPGDKVPSIVSLGQRGVALRHMDIHCVIIEVMIMMVPAQIVIGDAFKALLALVAYHLSTMAAVVAVY